MTLGSKGCEPAAPNLAATKRELDQVGDDSLVYAKEAIIGIAYADAWRLWLGSQSPQPSDPVLSLCSSLPHCLSEAHDVYARTKLNDCSIYRELKRRNNVVNFLVRLVDANFDRLKSTGISWLRSKATLATSLSHDVDDLAGCPDLAKLGGYIGFLTLAQGYGALLALVPADSPDDVRAMRASAYLGIATTLAPHEVFRDPNDQVFCKIWTNEAMKTLFREALAGPVDHRDLFDQFVASCE